MKRKTIIAMLFALTISIHAQKIKIFGVKLDVKQIMGTSKLTANKYEVRLPEVLVRYEDYLLETIGSYRSSLYEYEPYLLFNLIDKGNYPLLDELNMIYYDEVVFQRLSAKPSIKNRDDYKRFKSDWDKETDYRQRKLLLFKEGNEEIAYIIQRERLKFTTSDLKIEEKKEVKKSFNADVKAEITTSLKEYNLEASADVVAFLEKTITDEIKYSGEMSIVEFDPNYESRLQAAFNGLDATTLGTDLFSRALLAYGAPNTKVTATSGMIIFKLSASFNQTKVSESGIKAELKGNTKLKLTDEQIAKISLAIGGGYSSKISSKFSSSSNNIFIYAFLTSSKIDEIDFKKITTSYMKTATGL